MALGLVAGTMIMLVTSGGLKNIRHLKQQERLHSNAIFLADVFAYWIKQGENLTVNGSSLEISLPDLPKKTISLEAEAVKLDSGVLTTSDVVVTGLTFTKLKRSVQIQIALKSKNANETLSITTTVAQRNNPL